MEIIVRDSNDCDVKGWRVKTRERVRNMSNRYSFLAVTTVVCALALSSQSVLAQTTVFSDQFNAGSTLNAAPTAPTATATSYEYGVGAATGASSSLNPGDLTLALGNTSSTLGEIAARFGAASTALANIGDFIDLQVTWVATANVYSGSAGTGTQVALGLYNSGGSSPQIGRAHV